MVGSSRSVAARALTGLYYAQSTGNDTGTGSGYGTGMGVGQNGTASQRKFIAALVFAESKSVRTSTIILAAFNALAAFATAASIIYDCYWASKRCNPKFGVSKFATSLIHPAETFPLVLAMGIVIQALAFAGIQGTGLQSLTTKDCGVIGQFMLPALFIVPYIQLVFGLECALRSFRQLSFQARGKYDVVVCIATISIMLVGTWIPSHINPQPDHCFASLVWFITRFGFEIVILLSAVGGLMIISALIIFIRLSTVNLVDQHQRIAASRMVYYLVLGIVSLTFVIPFFVTLVRDDADLKAAMMATVVLNLSGLMNGLLHLFLRSNTATTSFGPKSSRERTWDKKKHEIRIWGPNELAYLNQLADPVSGPHTADLKRSESRTNLVGPEKDRPISMESLQSPSPTKPPMRQNPLRLNGVGEMETAPSAVEALPESSSRSPKRGHARSQSYSLFPTAPSNSINFQDPTERQELTSIYDISDLQPPPAVFGGGLRAQGHRRDSSVASSATVQIGLRLSHAPSPSHETTPVLPLPSTTYQAKPKQSISPLRLETQNIGLPVVHPLSIPARSPRRPSPLNTSMVSPTQPSPERESCSNKTLPPTPKASVFIPVMKQATEPITQLSTAVYSPERRFPKATEVPQSATIPRTNLLDDGPQRSNSSRQPARQSKLDWI